ncbi:hypothetical protein [uncultured Bartonella sp.]|uniref:hypothetical protein n=1 Tax=uncultured Bartonella sp. TaxID=104108 RepID=UPI0025DE5535|nr:hypothetical protein [uncultured Bartonella sp.]
MPTVSQRYARLLKAQKLVKARDEAELEGTQNALSALSEEDRFLFSLMEKGSTADFFDPTLLSRRLEKNARKEAILGNLIAEQRRTLLQSSRRCDVIDEKRKAAQDAEERKDIAKMLEEYVAAKIVKDTSLG